MTDDIAELMVCRIASEVDESGVTVLGSFTPLAYAAYMLARLTMANVTNDSHIVAEVASLVQKVKTGWDQVVEPR